MTTTGAGRVCSVARTMGGEGVTHPPPALKASKPRKWATWSLLLSPFVIMALVRAKTRRLIIRTTLSILLPLIKTAARALNLLPPPDSDPNSNVVEDPDLPVWPAGGSSLVAAEKRAKKSLWEWWLDALRFSPDSAGRAHIRQLLAHPETSKKLESLFNALDTRHVGVLDADALVKFSAGIRGTVRVLLDRDGRKELVERSVMGTTGTTIELEPATPRESKFLVDNFALLFPPEHPLDLHAFLSMAKLVLIRRIVKALVKRHGLQTVRSGMKAPLVVDLSVIDMGTQRKLFVVHTVAPRSVPGADGHRLGAIVESPQPGVKVDETKRGWVKNSNSKRNETSDADSNQSVNISDIMQVARSIENGQATFSESDDEPETEETWSDYG